jgi:hypothetical protein
LIENDNSPWIGRSAIEGGPRLGKERHRPKLVIHGTNALNQKGNTAVVGQVEKDWS